MPVILAIGEAEIRRVKILSQPLAKSFRDPQLNQQLNRVVYPVIPSYTGG
jgi:hypothetical protein